MNVPVLASRVARRYASLHGAASLHQAGLFDRDLVTKAVKYVLADQMGTAFGRGYNGDLLGHGYVSVEELTVAPYDFHYAWNSWGAVTYDTIDLVESFVDEWHLGLPMSIMAQVPPAQHMEFMQEVLRAVMQKFGAFTDPLGFLEWGYPDAEPFGDTVIGDIKINRLKVTSAKLKPPVIYTKRVLYKGKFAVIGIKLTFTDIVIDPDDSNYEWIGRKSRD